MLNYLGEFIYYFRKRYVEYKYSKKNINYWFPNYSQGRAIIHDYETIYERDLEIYRNDSDNDIL